MPALFETVLLTQDGYDHLPRPDAPYFLVANEGTFLHKDTQIGDVFVKETTPPKTLPKLGAAGVFRWADGRVPANIISQAHDFFLRIWQSKHAEAEVLITMHNDTREFRLFVPYQRVSSGGVKSIYEPTHVSREYTVVGTLHSHCDFSAFHSGTDSGDASDMDGVHFTIGRVNQPVPEIVAMVAMNGTEFHYKTVTDIADVQYGTTTAPPWWDKFVFANNEAPAQKPESLISITDEQWREFLGIALHKPKTHVVSHPRSTNGYGNQHPNWSPNTWPGGVGNNDWRREVYGAGPASNVRQVNPDPTALDIALDEAEKFGLITEEDWDDCPDKMRDDAAYWQGFFLNKMEAARDIIETLGVQYVIGRPSKKGKK